jgi:hypothetical protein
MTTHSAERASKYLVECEHRTLYFGSGDYYLICRECNRYWRMEDNYVSNVGKAANLSGQDRTAVGTVGQSNDQPQAFQKLDRSALVKLIESYFGRVRKLGGDTGECCAYGLADWLLWDGKVFLPEVAVAQSATVASKVYECSHPGCACEEGRCLADESNLWEHNRHAEHCDYCSVIAPPDSGAQP